MPGKPDLTPTARQQRAFPLAEGSPRRSLIGRGCRYARPPVNGPPAKMAALATGGATRRGIAPSFRRAGEPGLAALPGTRPSLRRGQLLLSSGVPSLDAVLGACPGAPLAPPCPFPLPALLRAGTARVPGRPLGRREHPARAPLQPPCLPYESAPPPPRVTQAAAPVWLLAQVAHEQGMTWGL